MDLINDLRHWASIEPDRVALQIGDASTTYAELEAWANRLQHLFAEAGMLRGAHIAGILPNGPLVFVVAWAALRCGLYFTPIATTLSAREITHIVADSHAAIVIADARYANTMADARETVGDKVLWLSSQGAIDGFARLEQRLAAVPDSARDDESPGALMMYTSGTTGQPRGVWRPLAEAASPTRGPPPLVEGLAAVHRLREGMRYLSPAPLYHAAPLQFSLTVTALGGTVFVMEKFDAAAALDMLVKHRITHSQWVPTMFQRLLQLPEAQRLAFAAPDHEVAWHAAAPCPPTVKRAMIDWWGPILVEYYGGSEGVGNTRIDSAEWLARPGSVGTAVKGKLHIVDEEGSELPPGREGRVYFSGVSLFEYFGDPAKTAARRHPSGYQTLCEIGYVDDAGYLFLTDRMDDMVISGGVNVYPQEIEHAILEMPEVADCGVVGVPDERFGERPVAFIVVAPSGGSSDDVAARVHAHCELRLGRIKRPDRIVVLDELPRSATGKLLRRRLRDLLRLSSGQRRRSSSS